jgi:hypothetical protein
MPLCLVKQHNKDIGIHNHAVDVPLNPLLIQLKYTEIQLHTFLASNACEWVIMFQRAGLDVVAKRKYVTMPIIEPIASHIHTLHSFFKNSFSVIHVQLPYISMVIQTRILLTSFIQMGLIKKIWDALIIKEHVCYGINTEYIGIFCYT